MFIMSCMFITSTILETMFISRRAVPRTQYRRDRSRLRKVGDARFATGNLFLTGNENAKLHPSISNLVRSPGHCEACGDHVILHRGCWENHATKMGGAGSVCFTATVAPTSSDEVSARMVRKLASSVPEGSRTR